MHPIFIVLTGTGTRIKYSINANFIVYMYPDTKRRGTMVMFNDDNEEGILVDETPAIILQYIQAAKN